MIDEGPSPEDLDRFGGDTACCPDCGSEIWDQADICPDCGAFLTAGTTSRPPTQTWWRRRSMALISLLVVAALLFLTLRFLLRL